MAMPDQQLTSGYLGIRLHSNGTNVAVNAAQKIDQRLTFATVQTGQEAPLAFECGDDHRVMLRSSFRGERNRVTATIQLTRLYLDQLTLLHSCKRSTDGAFVEADDIANSNGGDSGLNREERHDSPFRDVHAEFLLIQQRSGSRELVRNKCHESRNVTLKVESLRCPRTSHRSRCRCFVVFPHKSPRQTDNWTIKSYRVPA